LLVLVPTEGKRFESKISHIVCKREMSLEKWVEHLTDFKARWHFDPEAVEMLESLLRAAASETEGK